MSKTGTKTAIHAHADTHTRASCIDAHTETCTQAGALMHRDLGKVPRAYTNTDTHTRDQERQRTRERGKEKRRRQSSCTPASGRFLSGIHSDLSPILISLLVAPWENYAVSVSAPAKEGSSP